MPEREPVQTQILQLSGANIREICGFGCPKCYRVNFFAELREPPVAWTCPCGALLAMPDMLSADANEGLARIIDTKIKIATNPETAKPIVIKLIEEGWRWVEEMTSYRFDPWESQQRDFFDRGAMRHA